MKTSDIKKSVDRVLSSNSYSFRVCNLGLGSMDVDPHNVMNRWMVIFTDEQVKHSQMFDYYTGTGLTRQGEPVPPCAADVLCCLLSDASAAEESFSDWCGNFGYDSDSLKAFGIYNGCKANAAKLNKIFTGGQQSELQKLLQDY